MKAIRIHKFGPTEDVLQYEDVPAPEPKAGEILIKVEAASKREGELVGVLRERSVTEVFIGIALD